MTDLIDRDEIIEFILKNNSSIKRVMLQDLSDLSLVVIKIRVDIEISQKPQQENESEIAV